MYRFSYLPFSKFPFRRDRLRGVTWLCLAFKGTSTISSRAAPIELSLPMILMQPLILIFQLEVDASTQSLTGKLVPSFPIIDAAQKRSLLRSIAAKNSIPISQTIAVGDGANDLPMLHEAGLGVAWRAKSKVQLEAPTRLNGESLVDVLYLLGLGDEEIKELIGS